MTPSALSHQGLPFAELCRSAVKLREAHAWWGCLAVEYEVPYFKIHLSLGGWERIWEDSFRLKSSWIMILWYIYIHILISIIWSFPKMVDPQVTMGFNTKSWSMRSGWFGVPGRAGWQCWSRGRRHRLVGVNDAINDAEALAQLGALWVRCFFFGWWWISEVKPIHCICIIINIYTYTVCIYLCMYICM